MKILIKQSQKNSIEVSSQYEAFDWIEKIISYPLSSESSDVIHDIFKTLKLTPSVKLTRTINRYSNPQGKTIDLSKESDRPDGFRILAIFYPALFTGESGRIAYLYPDPYNNRIKFQFIKL